jgi:uncharacterized phage-associated protein
LDMPRFARVNSTALDAANYILTLADRERVNIDPITLQKILFYCQCWSLADGQRLFDDRVEAWKHGPVVRGVWKAYSGASRIQPADNPRYFELSGDRMELIESVWRMLKGVHGFTLSEWTHRQGTAWANAREGLPETAESNREVALQDMAAEATRLQQDVQNELSAAWSDVREHER